MNLGKLKQFRSWFISAGIVLLVTVWLASGQVSSDAPEETPRSVITSAAPAQQSSVRVRTQSAEEIMRTIVVNGEERVLELAPSLQTLCDTLLERGDPRYAFTSRVTW